MFNLFADTAKKLVDWLILARLAFPIGKSVYLCTLSVTYMTDGMCIFD